MKRKTKLLFWLSFAVLLLLGVSAAGLFVWNTYIPKEETSRTVQGGELFSEVRTIGELATLEYRYVDVIHIVQEKNFKLDPRKQILIVQYEGIMKLGIDCSKIKISAPTELEDGTLQVKLTLPPVQLLSSEMPPDSVKELVDQGVFMKKVSVSDYLEAVTERLHAHEEEVMTGEIAQSARHNAQQQLRVLFEAIPDLREHYKIIYQ